MGKHSTGPWSVRAGDGEVAIDALNASPCWYALATVITATEDDETGELTPDPQGEANARLIAAAPELLAALDRLVTSVDPESTGWSEACAAIAKATGGEP